jgi:hypothetical protein
MDIPSNASKKKKKTRPHVLNSSDESNDSDFLQAVSCPTAEKGFCMLFVTRKRKRNGVQIEGVFVFFALCSDA